MNKLEIVKDGDIARLKVTKQVNGSPFTYTAPKTGALEGSEDGAIAAVVETLNQATAMIPENASDENKLVTEADLEDVTDLIPDDTSEENPLVNEAGLGEVAERVTTAEGDIDTIEGKIPSGASSSNKLVTESDLEAAQDSWQSGFTPKGEATVSQIDALTTQSNGDQYIVTDSGTIAAGTLAVTAGDTVAWDSMNEVWYKVNQYAKASDVSALQTKTNNISADILANFEFTLTSKTANLFDGSLKPTEGYYDSSSEFHAVDGYFCTAPIFIKGGVEYKYPFQSSQFSSNTKVFITNKDGEVLGSITGAIEDDYNTFTAENYCYVVLNIGTRTNLANFMLCEYDRWPAEYVVGYGYDLNAKVGVSDENLRDVIDLSHLPSEIFENGQVVDNGVNLFNKDAIKSNYYINYNGEYVSGTNYFVSNPIKVMKGKQYSFYVDQSYFYGNKFFAYVSESDFETITKVARYTESNNIATFTAEKTGYVRFSGYGSTASVMFSAGEYPNAYIGYHARRIMQDIEVPFENIINKVNYKNLPPEVLENRQVIDNGINLFNQSSLAIKNHYYIMKTGTYASGSGYWVSHPIFVAKGFSYSFNVAQSAFGNNKVLAYVSVSDLETITDVITYTVSSDVATFTASKDGYIRFSGNGSKSEIMFAFAALFPEEYVAYHQRRLMDDIILSDNQMQQRTSKLAGKIISFNGDSICYGDGYEGGYAKIIADTYGMTLENRAVNGRKMCYYGNNTAICRDVLNMRADADFAIIEGGVNDMSNENVGSLTSDYRTALDDSTLYGAFETMCKNLQTRFAGKKVGYIAVHKIRPSFSSMVPDGVYAIAKKCCQKWSIPFCNLNDVVPPWCEWVPYEASLTPLCNAYTKNGDGWHPNEQAYRKYYVPKIVSWLESL